MTFTFVDIVFTSGLMAYDFRRTMSFILYNNLKCRVLTKTVNHKEVFGFRINKYKHLIDVVLFCKFHRIEAVVHWPGSMEDIVLSLVPGLPRVWWPLKVVSDTKDLGYCRSDNAWFPLKDVKEFNPVNPDEVEKWKSLGSRILKKKPTTLKAFLLDIHWAIQEVKVTAVVDGEEYSALMSKDLAELYNSPNCDPKTKAALQEAIVPTNSLSSSPRPTPSPSPSTRTDTCTSSPSPSTDSSSQCVHLWTLAEEKQLISSRLSKEDDFFGNKSHDTLWRTVCSEMNAEGKKLTKVQIINKWKSLKKKYKEVNDHNSKTVALTGSIAKHLTVLMEIKHPQKYLFQLTLVVKTMCSKKFLQKKKAVYR